MTTLHDLVEDLTEELNLTPEQQFRISAKIKRYVHEEKASVYYRYYLHSLPFGCKGEELTYIDVSKFSAEQHKRVSMALYESYENHQKWASLPDEEVVTWDVGSFKYPRSQPKCHPEYNAHTFVTSKIGDKCVCGQDTLEEDMFEDEDE